MKKVNLTLIFSVLLMLLTSDLLAQKHEFLANGNFEGNVSFVDGRPKPEFWKHRSSAGIDNSVNDGIPVLISNSKQGASQGYVYDSLPDCPYDTRHCQGTKNIFDEATTASIRVPLSTYEDSASECADFRFLDANNGNTSLLLPTGYTLAQGGIEQDMGVYMCSGSYTLSFRLGRVNTI